MKYTLKYLMDFIALTLLYGAVLLPRWRRRGRRALLVRTLLYLYLSAVLYFTLMPVLASLPFVLNHPYQPMNLVPFIDVTLGRGDFSRQVLLNILMTVPFGFLFPLTQGRRAALGRTVLACFFLSLGIELLQPFFDRSSDITDLITNVTGGLLGYVFYALCRPILFWFLDRLAPRD